MNLKLLFSVFGTLFLAEIGDKTLLAVFSFAAQGNRRLEVFLGAAGALTLTSLLGVLGGQIIYQYVPQGYLHFAGGVLFMVIGVLMMIGKVF